MASGKKHAQSTGRFITVTLTFIASAMLFSYYPALVWSIIDYWREIAAFVGGLFVGHYATPDVRDQHDRINEGERLVKEHYGVTVFRLWVAIWWVPARLIPHRSPLSHLPGFATILAAVWLYWVPVALWVWYGGSIDWLLLGWHVAGWAVQDTVHLAQDDWRVRW